MHKKQQVQIYKSLRKKDHGFNIIMRNHNKFNLGMNSDLHFYSPPVISRDTLFPYSSRFSFTDFELLEN